MPFSESIDNKILDHFFGKATFAPTGNNRYTGLSSTTPTKTGNNVTEPTTGSYARVQLVAADMNVAAVSAIENNADQTFPEATADWLSGVNLTDMVMFDAATVGTFIASKALTVSKPVFSGDTAEFQIGNMDFVMGGAG